MGLQGGLPKILDRSTEKRAVRQDGNGCRPMLRVAGRTLPRVEILSNGPRRGRSTLHLRDDGHVPAAKRSLKTRRIGHNLGRVLEGCSPLPQLVESAAGRAENLVQRY